MAASSSSSASVTIDGFTYDVFISFRGPDTRHIFTGSLWKALEDRGIRTFFDKEDIPKGKEITPSLLQSIEQSRMAIVVLSPNYASSAFCLDELSHILDHIRGKGRLVWPIFYEVVPSDVRWLQEEGTYGKAMAEHEASTWYNTDRLQKWKKALYEVANLSGTYFKNGGGYQYEFIEKIVEEVSKNIKPFTLYVADYLVGLEPQKQEVISLLNVGSDDKVHMVGIHGVGGIGKTTLSLAVYNSIADQFDGLCYLERVRENSEKHGLTHLQNILLYDIFGEKTIKLTSVGEGITILRQRLRQKKVLLLLDDVDKEEQLRAIAGEPNWFGPGSRVIITTRDTRLLTCHGVESTFEMKELNERAATKLLRWNAFHTVEDSPGYADVLNRATTYASGLPLALKVIGSHLYKKTIDQCNSTLDRYERTPNKEILTILKVSFDALEEEEKNVFLDIACCFRGYELAKVEKILHAHHGNSKKHHISVLVEKSLIKISESDNVTMHDLIEDMGKEIVKLESPEEPGKRSRLWFPEDIVQVLENNKGTSKNKIICVGSWIRVKWDGQAFKNMENLRTLIIRSGDFSEYPKYLPNSLRVLQWRCYINGSYPLSSSEDMLRFNFFKKGFNFFKQKLENMSSSKDMLVLKNLLNKKLENMSSSEDMLVFKNLLNKMLENMRVLVIKGCSLTHTEDKSDFTYLEEISVSHWDKLTTIDDSFGSLEVLNILLCDSLLSIPLVEDESLGKFKILSVEVWRKLTSIPPLRFPSLEKLKLETLDSLESISFIDESSKLKMLSITFCRKLKSISPLNLSSLVELKLSFNDSLESIPPMDGLPSLEVLDVSHCESLESILSMDGLLGKLKLLRVEWCPKLRSIPPLTLPSLEKLSLSYCDSLESIAPRDMSMGKVKFLSLEGCGKLTSIPPLELPLLEHLNLSRCDRLESFPKILGVMKNITEFNLYRTPIKKIPFSLQNLTRLQTLTLKHCGNVQLPSRIVVMSELTSITMVDGGWLFSKEDKGEEKGCPMQSSQVEFITLEKCSLSNESLVIGLKWFANVKELNLRSSNFTILPKCIEQCQFLWKLVLDYCNELQEIKGIPPSLKTLSAVDCNSLASSCKSELLNQELHEVGNTNFLLPLAEIPEWFGHHCGGGMPIAFWFRNKFPDVVLCVVSLLRFCYLPPPLRVIINGNTFSYTDFENGRRRWQKSKVYHLHLFHMQMEKFNENMDKAFSKNKWNPAEIDFGFQFMASGIHVLKEGDDVKFTSP